MLETPHKACHETEKSSCNFRIDYPLVNVYITMERSTIFNGKTHYFDWAIFGKSHFLMGKLTISMAIFNSFLFTFTRPGRFRSTSRLFRLMRKQAKRSVTVALDRCQPGGDESRLQLVKQLLIRRSAGGHCLENWSSRASGMVYPLVN